MRKFKRLYVILSLILMISSSAYSYQIKKELEELIVDSELIITGKVSQIEPKFEKVRERTIIYTYITINYSSIIKGDLEIEPVVIKMLGGIINGKGIWSDSYIPFNENEEVLLFLKSIDKSQNFYKINSISGKISINEINGKKIANCSMIRKNHDKKLKSYMELENLLKSIKEK